jgi:hypothetical protein
MIIDNTYFVNEIFIPHAKPSVTDSVTGVAESMIAYIEHYEREALIKCLGYQMYLELVENIDVAQTTLIKTGADEKWDWLVNGHEYTLEDGTNKAWLGLRVIIPGTTPGNTYKSSLLAQYVYYHYNKSTDTDTTGVGDVIHSGENSETVSKTPKVVAAMRNFVKMVQGEEKIPEIFYNGFGIGVDWYNNTNSYGVSLYEFIKDNGTFDKFVQSTFRMPNQFGI